MPEQTGLKVKDTEYILRLILRSVYLKGHQDGNTKTTDLSWEDEIIEDISNIAKLEVRNGM